MSAFIVSKSCIDAIVSYLPRARPFLGQYAEWDYFLPGIANADATALGQALWDMNRDAVNDRYREADAAPVYTASHVPTTAVRAYKAIGCLLYQCSEGDVPQRDLFRKMERLSKFLADMVISELPEYKAVRWGE